MAPRAAKPAKASWGGRFSLAFFLMLDARQQLVLILIGWLIAPA